MTSEVEAIVPEALFERVQDMLVRRRKDRLAPQRYAGGYALTELLRCACGANMAGTNSRSYRYYRCTVRCGRPHVRANELDGGVMDLIRRTLITPKAVREMVQILNEDIRMRAERQGPDLERARSQVKQLEQQDANLRRALRSAGPRAAERITLEIEEASTELAAATARLGDLQRTERPLRITSKLVGETIAEMTGILEHAPLDTRVAWVRDLFEQIDVDSREGKAVAVWKAATDQGVSRSDSVSSWLRRAGASRLLQTRGESTSELALPRPRRSRAWLKVTPIECQGCKRVVERRSPAQRYCPDCADGRARDRGREGMARRRGRRT